METGSSKTISMLWKKIGMVTEHAIFLALIFLGIFDKVQDGLNASNTHSDGRNGSECVSNCTF